MNKNLVKILHDGGYSCVIAKGNEVRTFIRRGVADLYDLYNTVLVLWKEPQWRTR